jgi:glucose-6-phosphate dehydrogenase assembly protein OpcA
VAAPVSTPLDPRRIEAEIARVRERESTGFGGGAKANLFNLVVATPGSAPGPMVDAALGALLGRRPARIIRLAAPGDAATGSAAAIVSGHCSPGTLDRGVCLEEIEVSAGRDPLGEGAGAWAPLLARDIPTFLWIAGSWTPADLALEACTHADKLILDGSLADEPAVGLAALHRLREATRGRLAVADLAWSRTLALRVQAARAFDAPAARVSLGSITSVGVVGGTPAEALLFFLWLATRLDWRLLPGGPGGAHRFSDPGGAEVTARHERPAPLARGVRLSFVVRGGAVVDVACSEDGCAAIGEDRGPWRVTDDGELLLAEVDTPHQDVLLAGVLAMAGAAGRMHGTTEKDGRHA